MQNANNPNFPVVKYLIENYMLWAFSDIIYSAILLPAPLFQTPQE